MSGQHGWFGGTFHQKIKRPGGKTSGVADVAAMEFHAGGFSSRGTFNSEPRR